MSHKIANRFLIGGAAIVVASIVLMDMNYSGLGVMSNILRGSHILDSDLEARWPLLVGLALIFWGIYRRANSN